MTIRNSCQRVKCLLAEPICALGRWPYTLKNSPEEDSGGGRVFSEEVSNSASRLRAFRASAR